MKHKSIEFRVFRNGKCKAILPNETDVFEYVKVSAKHHPKSHFFIEKREIIFDSRDNIEDERQLNEYRKPVRDNAIHASIHPSDWDIGKDD